MIRSVLAVALVTPLLAIAQAPKELRAIFEVAGQDSGALLGSYVKGVGDLNKDGYADVAVSASGHLKTYICFGGPNMSPRPSLTLEGGGKVVSGDFNGDGWIDLAIEKPFMDTVYIYFGGAQFDTIPGLILSEQSDYFGSALEAGDINGDGFTDLVVSTSDLNKDSTLYLKGRIFVYPGASHMTSVPVTILAGDTKKAGLGADLAMGDINHDGKMDIVSLGYNQADPKGTGKYYYLSVFLGDSMFNLRRNYYIDERNVPGGFGTHVVSFDADRDGIDDILVNKIFIFKGGSQIDTLPSYYVGPPNNDTANFGPSPWVDGGGDFNRDGVKDILLSAKKNGGEPYRISPCYNSWMGDYVLGVFRRSDADGLLRGMRGQFCKKPILASHWGGTLCRA